MALKGIDLCMSERIESNDKLSLKLYFKTSIATQHAWVCEKKNFCAYRHTLAHKQKQIKKNGMNNRM